MAEAVRADLVDVEDPAVLEEMAQEDLEVVETLILGVLTDLTTDLMALMDLGDLTDQKIVEDPEDEEAQEVVEVQTDLMDPMDLDAEVLEVVVDPADSCLPSSRTSPPKPDATSSTS